MAERLTRQIVAEKAIVHDTLPAIERAPHQVDRTFELPTALYGITAALFLGFIVVMALGFGNPALVLPLAVCALLIVAFFGTPAIWARLAPPTTSKAKGWGRFQHEGIQTPFGNSAGRDAAVQVLILPVLIFLWGLATVTIAAIVR